MATKIASAHSFVGGPYGRLHITQRPAEYSSTPQSLTAKQLEEVGEATLSNWIAVHDALHAGVKELEEAAQQTALARCGLSLDFAQEEPLCTVWGAVKFGQLLEMTITVHADTLPQDALNAAIAHIRLTKSLAKEWGSAAPQETAPAAPKPKQAPSSAPAEQRDPAVVTHFDTFDGKAKEEHAAAGLISFDVHRIERQFTPKGQMYWAFYGLWNGRHSQYPCAGVRVYEDGKFLPEQVLERLQDVDEGADGLWRITARVVRKGDSIYYNVQEIEPLEEHGAIDAPHNDDADIPF